jgi:hypothetical protein
LLSWCEVRHGRVYGVHVYTEIERPTPGWRLS